jgi:hypothetical protein
MCGAGDGRVGAQSRDRLGWGEDGEKVGGAVGYGVGAVELSIVVKS